MFEVLLRSIQFWMLVGAVIGGGVDYMIGEPPDWGVGLVVGLAAGGVLGFLLRRRAR